MEENQTTILVIPYPTIGHINPLFNLCHLLSPHFRHEKLSTVFTVVVTDEWLRLTGSDTKPDNVRFTTMPDVHSEMTTPFDLLLDSMELPVEFIIADVMLLLTMEKAKQRKIPIAAYWSMSASMLTLLCYSDTLQARGHVQSYESGNDDKSVDYLPGLSPISLADLPWPYQVFDNIVYNIRSMCKVAQSLLLTTIYKLEPSAIDAINNRVPMPVYVIGPNLPDFQLQPNLPTNEPSYFSWLDSKPPKSVLYVSLGSLGSVSRVQIDEILAGLNHSGVNFLWAAREEASRLSGDCGSNGLVVEWCNQWRVLSHSSVGGFMSHCGWNSTKESLVLGVPMLTFPVTGDQLLNGKLVFEDWKNGWKSKTRSFVNREEIEVVVRRFMDLEGVLRKQLMENVKDVESLCWKGIAKNGPVSKEINSFIRDSKACWFLGNFKNMLVSW